MKLNNGKGWEAMKQHPSQHHLHAANAVPNSSARALGGGNDTTRGPRTPGIPQDRLNAAQPLPPSPAKPGVGPKRERQGASGATPLKRQSGAGGGLTDVGTPTASTQAPIQSYTGNIPNRTSQANPGMIQQAAAQQSSRQQTSDPKPTMVQKLMKILCCGR